MKAIVIAAGVGNRMGSLTLDRPKCLLPVGQDTLLSNLVGHFRRSGIEEIAVVTGYLAERVDYPGLTYFHNDEFRDNNILQSLMYASAFLDDDVIVSYSDIWVEPWIILASERRRPPIWQAAFPGKSRRHRPGPPHRQRMQTMMR